MLKKILLSTFCWTFVFAIALGVNPSQHGILETAHAYKSKKSSYSYSRKSKSSSSLWSRSSSSTKKKTRKVASSSPYKKVYKPKPAPKKKYQPPKKVSGYGKVAGATGVAAGTAAYSSNASSTSQQARETKPVKQQSVGGYAKVSTPSTSASSSKPKHLKKHSSSALSQSVSKKQSAKAYEKARKEKSRFAKKPESTFTNTSKFQQTTIVKNVTVKNYNTYYSDRDSYYSRRSWTPPRYVYHSRSSFGMWDALFMWSILDSIEDRHYSSMYYHHQHDVGFREWRREADRLAMDNAELRAKLNRLDSEMHSMQSQGISINDSYLPPDTDESVVLASEIVVQGNTNDLIIGTGTDAGLYHKSCLILKSQMSESGINVECRTSSGGEQNMVGLTTGALGGAFVQSNDINEFTLKNRGQKVDSLQANLYPEVLWILANRQSGLTSIKQYSPRDHHLYVGGTGAKGMIEGFAREDSKYIPMAKNGRPVEASLDTLELVANNPNGVFAFVCGINCPLIQQAEKLYGNKLRMAAADDWDFNDAVDQYGNEVYRFVTVPEVYPSLQKGGLFSSPDTQTLAVDAVFVLSKAWADQAGISGLTKLEKSMWPTISMIQQTAGLPVEE